MRNHSLLADAGFFRFIRATHAHAPTTLRGTLSLMTWWLAATVLVTVLVQWAADHGWVVLPVVGATLLFLYFWIRQRYRRGLIPLYEGLVNVQDGNLKPVEVPAVHDPFLHRLYEDYNRTITTLSGMFALVEECQSRVLSERNRMNVVVQVLPAALLTVDDNLVIISANKQAEMLLGFGEVPLLGANLFQVLQLDEGPREILRDAFLYQRDIRNQVIVLHRNDDNCWVSMNLSFVTEDEEGMAAVITMLDISDYKHLQESVYIREKLVAMGQLAAGVAHELNTPLGSILGYSSLLLENVAAPQKMEKYAHIISNETKRCSRIVQNLLNFARKESCIEDRCEIDVLINEVVDTLISCRLKNRGIRVERELVANLVAEGGCAGLDIVLTNLLVNAVRALEMTRDPVIRVRSFEASRGWITVEVEDNGRGIPPELRARIFEPFFTTTDVGEGSGLGLSISHAMVVRRGGTLHLDPRVTEGALFVIRLPRLEGESRS